MKFKIFQTKDAVIVYHNENEFLNVETKVNCAYDVTHSIYQNGILILICSSIMLGPKKFIRIKYQNLVIPILWKRKILKKHMFVNTDYYDCNWHYFSKNCCSILVNKRKVADIFISRSWLSWNFEKWDTPDTYQLTVYDERNHIAFFSVIRFLIDLPYLNI